MKYIVAFIGKAGAGKDTIADLVAKRLDAHVIVSCTTRPKRDYEVDGLSYHFLDAETFAEKVLNGEMLEATFFNDWCYGTVKSDLIEGINIGVFNPAGIEALEETMRNQEDIKLVTYYVMCSDKTRMRRQLDREQEPDVKEIVRRFMADEEDFKNVEDYLTITPLWNESIQDLQYVVDDVVKSTKSWAEKDQ